MFQQKAMELGAAIISTEEFKRFEEARQEFENDGEAQRLMKDYEAKERELSNAMTQKEMDADAIARLSGELEQMRKAATENGKIIALSQAQAEFDKIMRMVNSILVSYIDPQSAAAAAGCSGDCSGCQGCH